MGQKFPVPSPEAEEQSQGDGTCAVVICPIIGIAWDRKTPSSRASHVVLVNSQKTRLRTPIVSTSSVRGWMHRVPPASNGQLDPRARKSRRCRRSNYQIVRHFSRVGRERERETEARPREKVGRGIDQGEFPTESVKTKPRRMEQGSGEGC